MKNLNEKIIVQVKVICGGDDFSHACIIVQ
jgi:hypothetical protein